MSAPDGAQAEARDAVINAAAREAFWTDDISGHHKAGRSPHTWENIPEVGRENYRTLIRAVVPIIEADLREHIAREIEVAADVRLNDNTPDEYGTAFWNGLEDGYEEAAHVARGAL